MLQFLPIYLSHREFTPPQHIAGRERNNAPLERSYARTERGYAETERRAAEDYHNDILRCTITMTARGTKAACRIVV